MSHCILNLFKTSFHCAECCMINVNVYECCMINVKFSYSKFQSRRSTRKQDKQHEASPIIAAVGSTLLSTTDFY